MSVRTTVTHLHFFVADPEMSLDATLEVHTGHLVLAFLPMYQIILKQAKNSSTLLPDA